MGRISIRDLHLRTGEWVRRAAAGGSVVVTDRGRPVATLAPYVQMNDGTKFADRRILPEFEALRPVAGDATADVSKDRDRG